jgi:hypothetical protein
MINDDTDEELLLEESNIVSLSHRRYLKQWCTMRKPLAKTREQKIEIALQRQREKQEKAKK